MPTTDSVSYTNRLEKSELVWWKRLIDVQAPYRWNIKRLDLAYTLEIGCGIGRNLSHLAPHGVGVDHNKTSIDLACERGFEAYTVEDFKKKAFKEQTFDSILIAHVLEHMTKNNAVALIKEYLPYLKKGGKVVIITPQELGYKSDPTHVEFVDLKGISSITNACSLEKLKAFSFPFPRLLGHIFKYNEFVYVAKK